MNTRDELIKLKEETGYNWKKFSECFGIPYRTIQDWYMGKRTMPTYLLRLISYKVNIEKVIAGFGVKDDESMQDVKLIDFLSECLRNQCLHEEFQKLTERDDINSWEKKN